MYLSHGNPSFLTTDDHGSAARFYIEEGLIEGNTISLRSALIENGDERENFFWRHKNGLLRE
jgi:hypothetical protein